MRVLVIDIGGSHVKLLAPGKRGPRKFNSGRDLTPCALIDKVRRLTRRSRYDVVALGYPGAVDEGQPAVDPVNLGNGWVGFDFGKAFGKPVRIVNDAVLQALGAYDGGRMLFLGLGTGIGSALVSERVIVPLDLGSLPYRFHETVSDHIGRDGLKRHGKIRWRRAVADVTAMLRDATMADYVVLGGGNAKEMNSLPERTYRGGNHDAFTGGFRLWQEVVEPHDGPPAAVWRVLR